MQKHSSYNTRGFNRSRQQRIQQRQKQQHDPAPAAARTVMRWCFTKGGAGRSFFLRTRKDAPIEAMLQHHASRPAKRPSAGIGAKAWSRTTHTRSLREGGKADWKAVRRCTRDSWPKFLSSGGLDAAATNRSSSRNTCKASTRGIR